MESQNPMSHNKKIQSSSSLQGLIELRSTISLDKTSAISLNLQDSPAPALAVTNSKHCTQRQWSTSIATFHLGRFEYSPFSCFSCVSHRLSHILVIKAQNNKSIHFLMLSRTSVLRSLLVPARCTYVWQKTRRAASSPDQSSCFFFLGDPPLTPASNSDSALKLCGRDEHTSYSSFQARTPTRPSSAPSIPSLIQKASNHAL